MQKTHASVTIPMTALGATAGAALLLSAAGCTSTYDRRPITAAETQADPDRPDRPEQAQPQRTFDPFMLAVTAEAERTIGVQEPVFADEVRMHEEGAARIFTDMATHLYGETPSSGAALGDPDAAMVLDGLESLQQVSFGKEGADFDPCISRDGKTMIFASTQHRPTSDIYMKRLDGRAVTLLTADPANDVMPALSPDGSRIAFCSNRTGSWDLFLMSSEGGQAVQLTTTATHELHPSWSPDGTRIVFSRLGERSGRWEMWVMDVDQPVVSEFIGYGLFPEWCPVPGTGRDGRDKILFQRSLERGDRRFSVWTVDYRDGDASSPTELASSQIAAVINPTWSPDGERILVATVPNPERTGWAMNARPVASDVWMMDADGGTRINLTKGRYVNLMPTWGPNQRVYFVSDREGVDNIWSIGTDKAIQAATGVAPKTNGAIVTGSEPTADGN